MLNMWIIFTEYIHSHESERLLVEVLLANPSILRCQKDSPNHIQLPSSPEDCSLSVGKQSPEFFPPVLPGVWAHILKFEDPRALTQTWLLWLDYCTTVLISGWQRKVWHLYICKRKICFVGTGFCLVVLGQFGSVLVLVLTVWGGRGWFLVVLGQCGVVLVDTWCNWASRRRYWLVLSGTWLVKGFYACIYLRKWRCHHSGTNDEQMNKER